MHLLATLAVALLLAVALPASALNVTDVNSPPTVAASAVLILLDQRAYNASASVPAWERTDAAPLAVQSMIVADDFVLPAGVAHCGAAVIEIGLQRALGRSPASAGGNFRTPTRATLWIWADTSFPLNRPLNVTPPPLARVVADAPEEPAGADWMSTPSDVGGGAGYTADTPQMLYHVEALRFRFTNLSTLLVGDPAKGVRYWVALSIALERAYNSTDFSQNQPRWMVVTRDGLRHAQELMGGASTQSYRVVDVAGTMFRTAPRLVNWTSADVAEATVLPFLTAGQARSDTRQLALGVFGLDCALSNASLVSAAIQTDVLPPRYVDEAAQLQWAPPPPSPSPTATLPSPLGTVDETPSPTMGDTPIDSSPVPSGASPVVVTVTPVPTDAVPVPPPLATPTGDAEANVTVHSPSSTVANGEGGFPYFWALLAASVIIVVLAIIFGLLYAYRRVPKYSTLDYNDMKNPDDEDDALVALDELRAEPSNAHPDSPTPQTFRDDAAAAVSVQEEYDTNVMLPVPLK